MSEDQSDAVTEVVTLIARPGSEQALEDAVREAIPLFQQSQGFHSMLLRRSVEEPTRYTLYNGWDHLDDHLVGFRESEAFGQWRALVTPHLAEPPRAVHQRDVVTGL